MNLIQNARISSGKGNEIQMVNILFDDKIREISTEPINQSVSQIIELEGKLLIPGCIDAHVHFNDPGYTHHETFTTGTTAAAFGGITTVIDMPCTSVPPVTTRKNLERKLAVIEKKAVVDFALWGGIRKNDFPLSKNQILELWNSGVVGIKIYTISGMETFQALSYDDIQNVFKQFPYLLFAFHAEDAEIIQNATLKLTPEELAKPENYLRSRPAEAEIKAVKKILKIGRNNRIHFVHVGSSEAANLILRKKKQMDVTFETCPHYLQFTAEDYPKLLGRLKTAPPVKNESDRKFLRVCLKNEDVDFITTDHAGCDWETEKNLTDFSKVYSGIPGTQLMIPYLFSEFYQKEKVPLSTLIKLTSENAAKRYGLFPRKGSLQIGTDADFTVIDLEKPLKVDEKKLQSIGKYSPFQGDTFRCSIARTIVRGETVFESGNGIQVKPGFGKWVKREY
ncbi:MAG: amidohydrolase family protein [Candidatus Cloacimonadales bacterium]|nr:amidohydrolase family protein [Candidatus Cloacimonadales bacterium]